jgi:hypothetical protein
MKDCVNVSVSLPYKLKEQIKEMQKTDSRYGWTAIFQLGYRTLVHNNDDIGQDLNVKIEKLATKLNFYVTKNYQLEEELNKLRAERG